MSTTALHEEPARYVVPRDIALRDGERMNAAEFMRRYAKQPESCKAELINGVVRIMQPVSIEFHGVPDNLVQVWLGTYAMGTPGIRSAGSSTIKLGPANVPQPDSLLLIVPNDQWSARVDQKGYLVGAPELAVEISATTKARDLRGKFAAYCEHGVREYLVWRVKDRAVDWWGLQDGSYLPLPLSKGGILKSRVFPGLWLDVPALLSNDISQVMQTLQKSLRSSEHKTFIKQLSSER